MLKIPSFSKSLLVLFVSVLVGTSFILSVFATSDSKGTEFWFAVERNYNTPTLSLILASSEDANVSVTADDVSFSEDVTVTAGEVTTVTIPNTLIHSNTTGKTDKGIHVVSDVEISAYILNRVESTTDASLLLPVDILDTEYYVMTYNATLSVAYPQLLIVGTVDGTSVDVTLTETVGDFTADEATTIELDEGQVYYIQAPATTDYDFTGSYISADNPVNVIAANGCVNIPSGYGACDHIVESIPPVSAWGENFYTVPLATRTGGDTFRILASEDDTDITVTGTITYEDGVSVGGSPLSSDTATLNAGEFKEYIITSDSTIVADKPVLLGQFSNGTVWDSVTSDPFFMIIPPFEQYLTDYVVSTPASGFSGNYINLVTKQNHISSLEVDGEAVDSEDFEQIGDSEYYYDQMSIELGSHTVESDFPVGVFVYGWDNADSYGYAGGMNLSPISEVSGVEVEPAEDCETGAGAVATVTDGEGAGVEGVRVDFTVGGDTDTEGSEYTNESGEATFCYESNGEDTVSASVGGVESEEVEVSGNTDPNVPTLLGPELLVSGGNTRDATPTFTFTLSDDDEGDQVAYRIQISREASFDDSVVDYTSALGAQGQFTFGVGQAEGEGTYTEGNFEQTLAYGNYYWRVKAIDEAEAESEYATANSGEKAFTIVETPQGSGAAYALSLKTKGSGGSGGSSSYVTDTSSDDSSDDDSSSDDNSGEVVSVEKSINWVDLDILDTADWRREYAEESIEIGLFEGKELTQQDRIFDLDNGLTRAEAAIIVCRMFSCFDNNEAGETSRYDDVAVGSWYFEAIEILSELGVLDGRTDEIFDPLAKVTRAEYLKMLMAGVKQIEPELYISWTASLEGKSMSYSDTDNTEWYYPFIQVADYMGIVQGYQSRTVFFPHKEISRVEAAKVAVMVMDMLR